MNEFSHKEQMSRHKIQSKTFDQKAPSQTRLEVSQTQVFRIHIRWCNRQLKQTGNSTESLKSLILYILFYSDILLGMSIVTIILLVYFPFEENKQLVKLSKTCIFNPSNISKWIVYWTELPSGEFSLATSAVWQESLLSHRLTLISDCPPTLSEAMYCVTRVARTK